MKQYFAENRFNKTATNVAKGIAILLLLFHHFFYPNGAYGIGDFQVVFLWTKGASILISFGDICVTIFALLSGYGIARSYHNHDYVHYVTKRYFSLMSTFWFVFITGWCLMFAVNGVSPTAIYSNNIIYGIIDALGLYNLFGTPTLNVTWWYMYIAVIIIFVAPIFVETFQRIKHTLPIIVLILAVILKNTTIFYLFSVSLGISAAQSNLFEKIHSLKIKNLIVTIIIKIITFIILLLFYIKYRATVNYLIMDSLFSLAIIQFSYDIFYYVPIVNDIFSFLGRKSGEIYMTHTFFYFYIVGIRNQVYALYRAEIIYIILLAIILVWVILLDFMQEKIHYKKYINKMVQKISPDNSNPV